jgi:hypothetical protein
VISLPTSPDPDRGWGRQAKTLLNGAFRERTLQYYKELFMKNELIQYEINNLKSEMRQGCLI